MRSHVPRPLVAIIAAALLVLGIKAFILDVAVVDGRSMRPLLEPGELVLVLRCAYGLRAPFGPGYLCRWARPARGEVVAAANPRDGQAVVKRVAAAGPAALSVAAGRLLGPGLDAALSEEQAARLEEEFAAGSGGRLPEGSVFLLGDNPTESIDSRDYGPLPVEALSGRVLLFARGAVR